MLNDNISLYTTGPIAQLVDPQTRQMTTYEHQNLSLCRIYHLLKTLTNSSGLTKFGVSSAPTNGNHYRSFYIHYICIMQVPINRKVGKK